VVGSVTSSSALLSVNAPAVITAQPQSLTLNPGTLATFSVTATGTAPLTYQWQKNGAPITGGTAVTFSIPSVQASDAASYSVVVNNPVGSVTSGTATLSLNTPVSITTQPQSWTVNPGTVAATGTAPLTYQWRKGGAPIAGGTSASLTLASVQASDAGVYDVRVGNVVGTVTSGTATLSVNAPVTITTQPASLSVNPGTLATFSVAATGTAPLTYQWRKAGVPLSGGTAATLAIPSVQALDAGSYDVLVSNLVGTVASGSAALSVNTPVGITTQPLSQALNPGTLGVLSVAATGTAPISYQWQKNGAPLSGGTSATYTLASVLPANAGTYTVVVSNVVGSLTSTAAVITVNVPVSITTQPAGVAVNPRGNDPECGGNRHRAVDLPVAQKWHCARGGHPGLLPDRFGAAL
jgi:hypothetical protein